MIRPERRGVSRQGVITEAKEMVGTISLAERLCGSGQGQMRRAGGRWVVRCPLPGHDDKTPSFTVYPDDDEGRGRWWCYGCLRGGDVVDLAALAWGIENPAVAAAEVLMTFGHQVPPRPPSWFRKFERQRPVRDAIGRARFDHLRRRLFRAFFAPLVARIEDNEEREEEAAILWESTAPLARLMVQRLGGGGR